MSIVNSTRQLNAVEVSSSERIHPLDTGLPHDQYARTQLQLWYTPYGRKSRSVIAAITGDAFTIADNASDEEIARAERLQELLDPQRVDVSHVSDPLAEEFLRARASISRDHPMQGEALYAVYRLHQVSMTNQLGDQTPSPFVADLIGAIVAEGRSSRQEMARSTHLFAVS